MIYPECCIYYSLLWFLLCSVKEKHNFLKNKIDTWRLACTVVLQFSSKNKAVRGLPATWFLAANKHFESKSHDVAFRKILSEMWKMMTHPFILRLPVPWISSITNSPIVLLRRQAFPKESLWEKKGASPDPNAHC